MRRFISICLILTLCLLAGCAGTEFAPAPATEAPAPLTPAPAPEPTPEPAPTPTPEPTPEPEPKSVPSQVIANNLGTVYCRLDRGAQLIIIEELEDYYQVDMGGLIGLIEKQFLRPDDVAAAVRLSRRTVRNIHENLFWAFIYNVIGIPLAAGAFVSLTGWQMDPMFGAAAMSLSSFCVVSNALRLNLLNIYDPKRDRKKKHETAETPENRESSTAVVHIKGMMCGHCEARVKKALEDINWIEEAQVSHEKGTAVITANSSPDEKTIRAAIKEAGYKVTRIDK